MAKGRAESKNTKRKKRTLKIEFSIYVKNCGDGSVSTRLFAKPELAEQTASEDYERFEEDIRNHELVIDLDTGTIVRGLILTPQKKE